MIAALLALVVAAASYRLRLLTRSGANVTFIMGWTIFELGRWTFSVPILVFFVTASFLSRVRRYSKSDLLIKSGPRDAVQVMANGLVPTIAVIAWYLSGDVIWLHVYLAAVATAAADTWATEIGMLSRRLPHSIITLRRVAPGTSGGVTLTGFCAAFGGAGLIVLAALTTYLLEHGSTLPAMAGMSALVWGVVGQMLDSLLGACCQARYECGVCGVIGEKRLHCNQRSQRLISGFKCMTNDMVNLTSVAGAAALAGLTFSVMTR